MRTVAVICAIAASAFIGPSAWADFDFATADIDQQQTSLDTGYAVGYSSTMDAMTMTAQTFTVGKTGMWYGIEIGVIDLNTTGPAEGLYYDPVSPPLIQIQGAQPGSTDLASVILSDPVLTDGWIRGTLVSPISVVPGQMYSIVVSAVNHPGIVSLGATTGDSYPVPLDPDGGALWGNDDPFAEDGGTWLELSRKPPFDYPVSDMQFRTFVDVVPLPAGVWLGILGLSVAGWRLKHQTP